MSTAPWHAGELALQSRVGVLARMDDVGRRFIRDYMPDQHREFFVQLPFVALGAVAPDGTVWATLRAGHPGFLASPDPRRLDISIGREAADPADPGLEDGKAIGLLGIDLATRRRNRMNGVLRHAGGKLSHIDVTHSFGNCPRYIQQRAIVFTRDPAEQSVIAPQVMDALDAKARALIQGADTLFVASYVDLPEGRQVDVSHRGGKPGFVRLDDDGGMTIPDFNGNLFFNTLGNFMVNPVAGVTFADFETGELLQMTGRAEVIVDSPEIAAFQGAERLWRFFPRIVVRRAGALPLRWARKEDGASPSSLLTGDWTQVADRLRAAALANRWRPFRVARIVEESRAVRSLHLEPADGAGPVPHQAGQFLPIRVTPPGAEKPLTRTYTLSVAPSDAGYRISVKRDGAVSQFLHDHVQVGDVIDVRAPAGAFTVDPTEKRPVVLLAAGIGVTPMLAMLRHIVYEGQRKQRMRPTWFFHSARSMAERAFAGELAALQAAGQGAVHVFRLLSDPEGARLGEDYDQSGRIDIDLLRARLPFDDYDFYLCGPAAFMQSLYDGLRALNVPDERIHAEAFGTSSLTRQGGRADAAAASAALPNAQTADQPAAPSKAPPAAQPATESVPVIFLQSAKEARWEPGGGSLLELAEARGLEPAFGCRGGSCGTCRTRIVQGAVAYAEQPEFDVPDGEALICCSVPAAGGKPLQLDL
ncbi:FAD-binding oxidoreductase [Bordetella genomosp. 8]|uniref:FAD-binding oxidoreductase n=1 Tax=Bordetella genomosp. 8 TaxID=1416806 RepID=A0A1W6YLF2_9BORD|nr:pyridoxamine 5'-phosphate oxidase family protein [Bordetella genomosp. 8]ARP81848.1 FAD-binding oxidoreductase [Bordetella genomosp. 8]